MCRCIKYIERDDSTCQMAPNTITRSRWVIVRRASRVCESRDRSVQSTKSDDAERRNSAHAPRCPSAAIRSAARPARARTVDNVSERPREGPCSSPCTHHFPLTTTRHFPHPNLPHIHPLTHPHTFDVDFAHHAPASAVMCATKPVSCRSASAPGAAPATAGGRTGM